MVLPDPLSISLPGPLTLWLAGLWFVGLFVVVFRVAAKYAKEWKEYDD